MKLRFANKYQEYNYKFLLKVSELTTKRHATYSDLPKPLSKREFNEMYEEMKIEHKLGIRKRTNYIDDIISSDFRSYYRHQKTINAVRAQQDKDIRRYAQEHNISIKKATDIFKAQGEYITSADVKYRTSKGIAGEATLFENIKERYHELGMTIADSYELQHLIGVEFFDSD